MTTITALPTPPAREDPTNFAVRADDFLAALPTFATETNAVASETNTAKTNAETAATTATTQAGLATTARIAAELAETNAETAATAAQLAETNAEAAQAAAELALDQFTDLYLGPKAADPTLDNDGNALLTGALYFNSVANEMRVWSGTVWVKASFVPTVAASVANTPAGNIAATTVQAAINELDTEKVAKTGDTMTGPLAQAAGTAALPSYTFSGDVNTGMWSPGADILAWSTAGSERLRIDTSGNVGIGGAPSVRFHVQGGRSALFANAEQYAIQLNYSIGTGANGHFLGGAANGALLVSDVGGVERLRIDTSGNVLVTGSGGLGYGVGSGGTVVQATSKSTAVTLNKPSGRITMHNAALAAGATAIFLVTNSTVTITDSVSLTTVSGTAADPISDYQLRAGATQNGGFYIAVTNVSGASKSDALGIQFNVHKGATS